MNKSVFPDYRRQPFFSRWLKTFAPDLTEEQYERLIRGAYIWHVFSWRIVPDGSYLSGDAARSAFDKIDKAGAGYINFFESCNLLPLSTGITSSDVERGDCAVEFYAVGENFCWTYIVTHETDSGFGPYFMSAPPSYAAAQMTEKRIK